MDDLCSGFHKAKRKYYPSRQRFTLPPADGAKRGTPLVSGKLLKDYDLQDGSVLVFKDLGPQVCEPPGCSGSKSPHDPPLIFQECACHDSRRAMKRTCAMIESIVTSDWDARRWAGRRYSFGSISGRCSHTLSSTSFLSSSTSATGAVSLTVASAWNRCQCLRLRDATRVLTATSD